MAKLNKILWTTDGSKEAGAALSYAKLFAKIFNSEIIGLHVIEVIDKKFWGLLGERLDLTGWVKDSTSKWFYTFDGLQEELKKEELKFTYKVVAGSPHEKIIEIANNEEKADLIVMGKRGLGLIDRMLIGITTLKVLRKSNVPVLAVKKRDEEGIVNISNILVPLDISEKVSSALNYAIDLAERINANISVLYVLRLETYTYEIPYSVVENLIKLSSNELAKRVEEIKLKRGIHNKEVAKLEINTEVIQGINLSVAIVDYASSKNTDLIVMNTHGRKGIKKFVLGSVAEKVIQEASCAVLALKP
ncbi:MAG: UspA domain protein [Candidatus Dadabacteria bacterium CSP1-2]|nr:MAG: UspA domain protein [Candidatus Dadabacteria bacterium CSP1-2]